MRLVLNTLKEFIRLCGPEVAIAKEEVIENKTFGNKGEEFSIPFVRFSVTATSIQVQQTEPPRQLVYTEIVGEEMCKDDNKVIDAGKRMDSREKEIRKQIKGKTVYDGWMEL